MPSEDNQKWFHLVLTTYGAWLPGDKRGFRTRHHRQHVEGDYKNPPPQGKYEKIHRASRQSLKQEPVVIPADLRLVVGLALKDKLKKLGALVIAVSVSGQHVHLLAKMPNDKVKSWRGSAKKHAWFELRDQGWKSRLWGKQGKIVPVENRRHQLNVFQYIKRHADEGAWVWLWKPEENDAPPEENEE